MASSTTRTISADERARRQRQSEQTLGQSGAASDRMGETGERLPTPEEVALAQQFFEQSAAQNLDEVAPEPVSVTIREYVERTEEDAEGRPVTRRRLVVRSAQIETFVPMRVFNRMMASRRVALARRATLAAQRADVGAWAAADAADDGDDDNPADDPVMQWMQQNVLRVWQLTEPDMTADRLENGLSFQQIQGLFARFFGEMLRQSGSNLSAVERGRGA